MQKIIVISLLLILSVNSFDYFFANPEQNFYLGTNQATCLEMASDQSMVVVGFQSGLIETFNMQGKFLKNITGHSSSILSIIWFGTIGYASLDRTGFIMVNWANGTLVGGFQFPATGSTLMGMTVTLSESLASVFVGLIYTNSVIQYQFNLNQATFAISRTYNVNNIVTALYTPNYGYLFISNNAAQVYYYNCTTGNLITTVQLNSNANAVAFLPYGNNYMLLDASSDFTEFKLDGTFGATYQSLKPGSVAAVCPSNLEIVFGYSSQAVLVTFQYGQTEGQQLSYMKSNARDIACGQNNLVTLDNANYLAFNTYNIVDSKILGWVIAVIVIAIVLFIALVVTIVYCICKKRKQALLNNTDYGKQLNSSRR